MTGPPITGQWTVSSRPSTAPRRPVCLCMLVCACVCLCMPKRAECRHPAGPKAEAAFANFVIWFGLAMTGGYFMMPYLDKSVMAMVCMAAAVSAAVTYLIAHDLYLRGQPRLPLTVPLASQLDPG